MSAMRLRSLVTDWRTWAALLAVLCLLALLAARYAPLWLPAGATDPDRRIPALLREASTAFQEEQRGVRRVAAEAASRTAIIEGLSGRSTDRAILFAELDRVSRHQEVSIDLYDADGQAVAWQGRSGPSITRDVRFALDGGMRSAVVRAAMSSDLQVVIPVRDEGEIVGAVAVRRTIELHYPITNRFLQGREGLSDETSRRLDATVRFAFGGIGEGRNDGATVPLYGIDSAVVGTVSVTVHQDAVSLSDARTQLRLLAACSAISLYAVLSVVAVRRIGRRARSMRFLAIAVLIWGARYLLLLFDLPSGFLFSGPFSPSVYASPFGGGLADSPAELFISACALAATVGTALWLGLGGFAVAPSRRPHWTVRIILAAAGSGFVLWSLRGYAAVVRSAVFDSSLEFGDPSSVLPSVGFVVVQLSLLLASLALLGAGALVGLWAARLLDRGTTRPLPGLAGWSGAVLLFAVTAALFALVQGNPLMAVPYRFVVAASFLALGGAMAASRRRGGTGVSGGVIMGAALAVLVLWYPLITRFTAEKDRERIESFAEELVRPVDSWFAGIVEDALRQFSGELLLHTLDQGNPEETSRLAFTAWAHSAACREGYAAIFVVEDARGQKISGFSIGGDLPGPESALFREATAQGGVLVAGEGVNAVRYYGGSVPIRDAHGTVLGYGRAVIAAARQSLFLGEAPSILRGAGTEGIAAFPRHVAIAEVRDGVALPSDRHDLPIGYTLPVEAVERFADPSVKAVWSEEKLGRKDVETYAIRPAPDARQVIALVVDTPTAGARIITAIQMIACMAIVAACWATGWLALRLTRRRGMTLKFRERLIVALLVTALVPLGVTAIYVRWFAGERQMERIASDLRAETATVAAAADPLLGLTGPAGSPATAEHLAGELGTDFNVYVGPMLRVSSRPALYETGILDQRMNGNAFAAIVLEGERFHVETESVGDVQFAVGYRPVLDSSGSPVAVVSVPTLYRQDDIQGETARTDAFLFGLSVLVLVGTSFMATTLAGRIAAPIQRLTEATRRLSRGDLDVTVDDRDNSGEVGELLRSFGRMTRDLRESRDALVQTERELAWKEMARQVAHEIKNPLTPMKLSIQHLRQTYRDGAADFGTILDRVTGTIIGQIEALSRIASEFSHFARMPRRHLEPADLNAIVGEAVELFARDARIAFRLELPPGLPTVVVDREEMRRALINVLRNGVQAMGGEGNVIVQTGRCPMGVSVAITDHGSGMTAEVRARLFQPNFSTKTDGMGLGLAIVKKTIDDLGGTIRIDSVVGQGTTVTMELPEQAPGGAEAVDAP